jgi:hypothetical protein
MPRISIFKSFLRSNYMTRKERRKRWFDSGGGDLGWTEESESYWRQLGRMDAIW